MQGPLQSMIERSSLRKPVNLFKLCFTKAGVFLQLPSLKPKRATFLYYITLNGFKQCTKWQLKFEKKKNFKMDIHKGRHFD
jgi:hypothetical protein